jgi:hypothetical protein
MDDGLREEIKVNGKEKFKEVTAVKRRGKKTTLHQLLPINITGKSKGKVVPVLSLNRAPRHEGVLGEWRYSSTHSLTSALDGGEWSASRLGRFTPRERSPGTRWIGGWLNPRPVPDAVVKRKIPSPRRESNRITQIVQPVA